MTDNKPFMTISETAAATGLSKYYLRSGIKNGTVPYIPSGNRYLVNVPALLEQLNNESRKGAING